MLAQQNETIEIQQNELSKLNIMTEAQLERYMKELVPNVQTMKDYLLSVHGDSEVDRYFCMFAKSADGKDKKQWLYRPGEMDRAVEQFKLGDDWHIYVSQQTYLFPRRIGKDGKKPMQRTASNLRRYKALYAEIDVHEEGVEMPDFRVVLARIWYKYFTSGLLPAPNLVTFSGRGLHFIWLIDAVKTSTEMSKLFRIVNTYFSTVLSDAGADQKVAGDLVRVMRCAGTANPNNGASVISHRFDALKYNFFELAASYIPAYMLTGFNLTSMEAFNSMPDLPAKKKKNEEAGDLFTPEVIKKATTKKKRSFVTYIRTDYNLCHSRIADLYRTSEYMAEKGIKKGYRELLCWLAALWTVYAGGTYQEGLKEAIKLNNTFLVPQDEEELLRDIASARPENSYKRDGLKRYKITDAWIFEKLSLSPEVKQELTNHLQCIGHKREIEREPAKRTRKEHCQNNRKIDSEAKKQAVIAYRAANPLASMKGTAKALHIAYNTVKKYWDAAEEVKSVVDNQNSESLQELAPVVTTEGGYQHIAMYCVGGVVVEGGFSPIYISNILLSRGKPEKRINSS
ncbi:hypothetical protein EV210_12333 [Anaerospora hongkongensis]|uniref:Uncharacterized protein n=1 Tax=Anaerospora hongkongensis TaxID=244830 RepID=A0A4R1PLY5_9FIRM|nr:hypothetical protein [Anaerospora hongkongensis]TCL32213.1 hypothetical protein EV210_12333 [Anaerospora hongkongensis]